MKIAELMSVANPQYGCITYAQGVDVMGRGRFEYLVATGVVRRVHPSTYVVEGAPDSWQQRAMAGVLSVPGSVLSHRSAARVWGMTFAEGDHIEITAPDNKPLIRNGITVHTSEQLRPWATTTGGFPVTTIPRTIVDMARYMTESQLGALLDQTTYAKKVVHAEVRHCLDQMVTKGRLRITRLRDALDSRNAMDEKLDSFNEKKVLGWIRENGFDEPDDAQHWMKVNGCWYRHDFVYFELKIDVEPDGPHHELPSIKAYDAIRDSDVKSVDWAVLRVPYAMTEVEFVASFREVIETRRRYFNLSEAS